ncbi:NAD+ diphosphatase [Sporomusaceae bacterium BoRhaA]|uniref:NAD(+) diphosphatase n=1 Tax=Pelorhabdus rhamnosifermentans TaxID=2772457 RepID=UPI001C063049|nr:NAD(+) diphosphatase [Pelorhabdus rhamnosifermentans]MBU2699881.1 NAD+ diphosphatase [Pelorhabdus rhamnosifermentans]
MDNSKNIYLFLFYNGEILVQKSKELIHIPLLNDISNLPIEPTALHFIGSFNDTACYVGILKTTNIPDGFFLRQPRQLYGYLKNDLMKFTLRSFHLVNWLKNNKFCGRCGGKMVPSTDELAMKCTDCDFLVYPRLSPAMIVAVVKDHKLLLAHSNKFPSGRYSVLAGFVEPGETLEDCVKREVKEEVGIEVKNIRYFDSQPWPFPDSLMIAFTAEYSSGELSIDNNEILAADWFSPDNFPDLPGNESIAKRLINWFTNIEHSASYHSPMPK